MYVYVVSYMYGERKRDRNRSIQHTISIKLNNLERLAQKRIRIYLHINAACKFNKFKKETPIKYVYVCIYREKERER